jgi:hypothetical protein
MELESVWCAGFRYVTGSCAHSASRLLLPKPQGAQEHQRLASGLKPSEQGRALHAGPGGPGHGGQLALERHAVFGLGGTAPRVTWDAASPRASVARFTPRRVIPG